MAVTGEALFVTIFTFGSTTLSLSIPSRQTGRQTAFIFPAAVSTEITIPSEHAHDIVNGVEIVIDLLGVTTTLEAYDYTDIIVNLPEVTTEIVFPMETTEFTFSAYEVTDSQKTDCGPSTFAGAAGAKSDQCVPTFTTAIIFPTGVAESTVFLRADSLTTSFLLPAITTTLLSVRIVMF